MKRVKVKTTVMCDHVKAAPTHREFSDEDYAALCRRYGSQGFGWYPIESGLLKVFTEEQGWRVFRSVRAALSG